VNRSMKQFSKMFAAQLKMTFREKQTWFWGIFFPVILMVVFMLIFGGSSDNAFEAKVAIVDEAANPASAAILEQLRAVDAFEIESGEPVSREQAEEWLLDGDVAAVIALPAASADSAAGPMRLELIVDKENEQSVTTQAVAGILGQFVTMGNLAAAGAAPVYELSVESVTRGSNELTVKDFILTGLIAMSIAQGGMFGMVDMVEMRRKGLLKRLRMTPAKMGLYGLGDMTVRMLFAVVQIILLSLIGVFAFGASLYIDPLSLFVVFLVGVLSFTAMGYLFSSVCKTMEAYMAVANIASFLMMFLAGIFFPVETMPEWLRPVSHVLPLTYFVDGLRDAMVYASGIVSGTFWLGIGILALWGVVCFGLGSLLYKSKSIAATR